MNPIEKIVRKATRHYYTALVAHPQARVWYYNLYQILEGDAEVPNIESAAGRFDDSWIEQRFERHANDERRHQQLWVDLLESRNIFNPESIPPWANFVDMVLNRTWFAARDKLAKQEQVHPSQLIVMFAGMHALEVLGVQRFEIMANLHRTSDPEIATLLDTIVKDERFHTAYTRESVLRLGRRYGCLDYAERCLVEAVKAYQSLGVTMFPRFVDHLRGMGVKFSPWFLLLNQVFKIYGRLTPDLREPPQMPVQEAKRIPAIAVVSA